MSKPKKCGSVSSSTNVSQEPNPTPAELRVSQLKARFRAASDEASEEYDKWHDLCDALELELEPLQREADRQLRLAKQADLRASRLEVEFHEAKDAARDERGKCSAIDDAAEQEDAEQKSNPSPPRPAPSQPLLERAFFRAHRADEKVIVAQMNLERANEESREKWDEWARLCNEAKEAGRPWVEPSTEPLTFISRESMLHTTKWSITAEEPAEDEAQILGEFSSLKKALRFLKKLNMEKHDGERITLTAPGGHFYDYLPVYHGKWVVGHVDPGTDEATVIETFYRRKDAIREVRDAIQKGLRPILVAPWMPDPFQDLVDEMHEAIAVDELRAAESSPTIDVMKLVQNGRFSQAVEIMIDALVEIREQFGTYREADEVTA